MVSLLKNPAIVFNRISNINCYNGNNNTILLPIVSHGFKTSTCMERKRTGRFRVSLKHDKPLTYEEFYKPHHIAHVKGWNSYNTRKYT